MTREEMLCKLKNVKFCAVPTVLTMDMGIEYEYITPEGVGTCLGRIGEWPAYRLKSIPAERMTTIKKKIADRAITEEDFQGTEIGKIIAQLHRIYGDWFNDYYGDLATSFENLVTLPDALPDKFYCMLDIRAWGEKPRFFTEEEEFLQAFCFEYTCDICPWENLNDEQLEYWCLRAEDDLKNFIFKQFVEESDE